MMSSSLALLPPDVRRRAAIWGCALSAAGGSGCVRHGLRGIGHRRRRRPGGGKLHHHPPDRRPPSPPGASVESSQLSEDVDTVVQNEATRPAMRSFGCTNNL